MKKLTFICGDVKKVPAALLEKCYVPVQTTQTEKQMAEIGFSLIDGPYEFVFTNISTVFDAVRVSVKRLDEATGETANVEIVFYSAEKETPYTMTIDKDGRINTGRRTFSAKLKIC